MMPPRPANAWSCAHRRDTEQRITLTQQSFSVNDDPDAPSPKDLGHPRREVIYDALRTQPGLNLRQLMRATGLSAGVVRHHLGALEEQDVVHRFKGERDDEVLFFTDQDLDLWDLVEGRALYGHASRRRVALYVHEQPSSSAPGIGEGVGLDPHTVRGHLDTLIQHGLVVVSRDKRPREYAPTEALEAWVEAMGDRVEEATGPS